MKGDFTRLTFSPTKHYTSVRMQQGRLQLDSDWNEQVDIQQYLQNAQAVDVIGSTSGVASVDFQTGEPTQNAFKLLEITNDLSGEKKKTDVAILPGHLYTRGILCDLSLEPEFRVIEFRPTRITSINSDSPDSSNNSGSSNIIEEAQIWVNSLVVGDRPFAVGQWLVDPAQLRKARAESHSYSPLIKGFYISHIDPEQLRLTVSCKLNQSPNETDNPAPRNLQRIITYSSQPDFPNPTPSLLSNPNPPLESFKEDTPYLAYLDVWQRHITALDDPTIREIALNVPDTTTRTKTVWQLKLQAVNINPSNIQLLENEKRAIADQWKSLPQEEKVAIAGQWVELSNKKKDDINIRWDALSNPEKQIFDVKWEQLLDEDQQAILSKPELSDDDKQYFPENQRLFFYEEEQKIVDEKRNAIVLNEWQKFTAKERDRNPRLTASVKQTGLVGGRLRTQQLTNQLYRVEVHQSGAIQKGDRPTFKWSRNNGMVASAIQKIQNGTIYIKRSSQDAWSDSVPGQWIEIITEEMELKGEPGILAPLKRTSETKIEFDDAKVRIQISKILGEGDRPTSPAKVRRWDYTTSTETIDGGILIQQNAELPIESGIRVKFNLETEFEYRTGDYWLIPARSGSNDIDWPRDSEGRSLAQVRRGITHEFSLLGVVSKTASLFDIRDERTQFVPLSRVLDTGLGGTIQGPLEVQANLYATGKTEQDSTGKESFVDSRISIGVQRSGDTLRVEPNQAQLEIRSNGQSNFVKLFDTQGINDYLVVTSEGNVRITGEALVTQETNLATTSGKVTIGDSQRTDETLLVQGNSTLKGNADVTHTANLATTSGKVTIGDSQRTDETLLVQGNSTFKGDADITRTANLATTSGKVTIGDSQRTDETLLVQGNSTFKGNAEVSGSTTLAIAPSTIVQIGELPDGESIPDNTKIQVIGNSVFAGQLTSNQLLLTTGILQSPETTDLQLQVNNTAYLTVHHTGQVGIGNTLVTPTSQLGISGNAAIGANYLTAETSALPPNGLIVEGTVGIGKPNPDSNFSLDIEGDIRGTGKTILGLANGATVQVGEGNIPGDPGEFQFYVNGSMNISQKATITETLHLHQGILNSSGVNSLAFQIGETPYLTIDASRTSAAGSNGADRTAQVRVNGELDVGSVIRGDRLVARNGKIASRNGTDLALQIGTTDHLTIDQTGNIGIGNRPRQNRKLFVDGALECDSLTLNSGLSLDQAVTVQSLTTTSGNIDTENNQDLALKVGGKQGITLDRNNNNIDVIIEDGAIKSRDSQPLTLLAGDQTKVELTNRDIVLQSDNQTKINISPRRIELQSDNDTAITVEPNQLKLDPGNRTGMTLKSDGDIILAENRGQVMIGTERIRVSENVDSTNIKLYVDGKIFGQEVNGRNIKQLSSATFKADISDLAIAESLEILRQLAPVKFKYRGDETNHIHAGFIAENTPDLLTSDNKKSVKLLDIVAVLTKALQQQDEEIAQLNKTVQTQREDIDYLAEKIRAIEMKGRSPWRRGARSTTGGTSLMSSTTHSPQKESPIQQILRAIRHLIRL